MAKGVMRVLEHTASDGRGRAQCSVNGVQQRDRSGEGQHSTPCITPGKQHCYCQHVTNDVLMNECD